jgi:electron transport complex protein RnfC
MPFASSLYLQLRAYSGAPAIVQVREGAEVERGQVLAEAADEFGVRLHAPATGRIVRIAEQADADGGTIPTIRLDPLPGDTQEPRVGRALDPARASPDELLNAIGSAGLVSLGGGQDAGESTHVRLTRARANGAITLVINGIDGEPVFERMGAVLSGQADAILAGATALGRMVPAKRTVLAVEEVDGASAESLRAAASGELNLDVQVLPPRYPQGADALLLRALALADGAAGSTPEAVVISLATVAEIGRLLRLGGVMTDQLVSLVGDALDEPGIYRVPLGTPLGFALRHAGLRPGVTRVLRGGPMRGQALASLDLAIGKGMTDFAALAEIGAGVGAEPVPCIRCGDCVAVCPVGLQPAELGLLARRDQLQAMHADYHLDHCIECGCCAYVCPSHIPLVQQFRAARAQWRRTRPVVIAEDAA